MPLGVKYAQHLPLYFVISGVCHFSLPVASLISLNILDGVEQKNHFNLEFVTEKLCEISFSERMQFPLWLFWRSPTNARSPNISK